MQRPDGMRPFLVVQATRAGDTRQIAERIVDRLHVLAHESELRDVRSEPLPPLRCYSAVTLAAGVHLGHHDREMVRFVRAHRQELAEVPTLLISVSLTAGATHTVLDDFVLETGWTPESAVPLSGSSGRARRRSMVRALLQLEGPQGTGSSVVLADWATLNAAVDALVREAVQRGRGVPTPSEEPLFRTALEGAVLAP